MNTTVIFYYLDCRNPLLIYLYLFFYSGWPNLKIGYVSSIIFGVFEFKLSRKMIAVIESLRKAMIRSYWNEDPCDLMPVIRPSLTASRTKLNLN